MYIIFSYYSSIARKVKERKEKHVAPLIYSYIINI